MAWVYLVFAGLLEVAWAAGLKRLGDGFSWALGAMTVLTMIASFIALYAAMARLPLGIAYPIWTGIGSVGSVFAGAAFFGQFPGPMNIAGLIFLIIGMFLISAPTT